MWGRSSSGGDPGDGSGARLRLQLLLATGLGAGLAPVAPGTAGSILGVALSAAVTTLGGAPAALVALVAVTAAGWWSAGPAARHCGARDPGRVVVDEVAGQVLALLFLPPAITVWLLAFLLFRLFDIVKPPPARRLEGLPGASGIMADDLVAGLYANFVLQLMLRGFPGLVGSP